MWSPRSVPVRRTGDGARRGKVTHAGARRAGGAVRGAARTAARGGVPDAGFARRGGRRRTGGLAAARPHRRRRHRQPDRLADHGRLPRLPGHAALPRVPAGGPLRRPAAGAGRRSAGCPRTRPCSPTRWGSRCWWCSTRWVPPSGSRSCCTICSRCRSTVSRRCWTSPGPPRRSSPAGPGTRCGARRWCRAPNSTGTGRSSRRSCPPRGAVTSARSSTCSPPTSSVTPTRPCCPGCGRGAARCPGGRGGDRAAAGPDALRGRGPRRRGRGHRGRSRGRLLLALRVRVEGGRVAAYEVVSGRDELRGVAVGVLS